MDFGFPEDAVEVQPELDMDERELKKRTQMLALRVIKLVQQLPETGPAQVIGKQLLRSGTSIGANYRSACRARSRSDFVAKLAIVEEEADESIYWIDLLILSEIVPESRLRPLKKEVDEILSITVASIKTIKSGIVREDEALYNVPKSKSISLPKDQRSKIQNSKSATVSFLKNPKSKIQNPKSHGFTLVEMLVALAILMAVMTGLIMMFTGSLRAVQTGYQSIDAFEQARGAMTAIQQDLTTSFGAADYASYYNFYGTPIGMTFVGVTKNPDKPEDVNIARITYVVYNVPVGEPFENAEYINAYPYLLLRYIEPGVGDLDSFPLPWEGSVEFGVPSLTNMMDEQWIAYRSNSPTYDMLALDEKARVKDDFMQAKRREYWIRALAGGDAEMPLNFWTDVLPNLRARDFKSGTEPSVIAAACSPYNYAIATNVMSVDPITRAQHWSEGFAFFDYDRDYSYSSYDATSTIGKGANLWWNDPRSLNCDETRDWRPSDIERTHPLKFCQDPTLPEIVKVSFWLMFASPYPGAPDFQRLFQQDVFIVSAYDRGKI